jgi:hypothetical protein
MWEAANGLLPPPEQQCLRVSAMGPLFLRTLKRT